MITLYQLPGAWGLPSISPFCLKVETYLRMTKIAFESKPADMRKAPKGKAPYIRDGARIIGDSGLILDHLKDTRGDRLDHKLGSPDRALGHLVRRTFEESLYFPIVYSRWQDDAGWEALGEVVAGMLPAVARSFLPAVIRRSIAKSLKAQGIGRHSRAEVYSFAKEDITALSAILGASSYFLGDQATSVDATAYGFLANILATPTDNPLRAHTRAQANLMAYTDRMKAKFFV